MTPSPSKSDRRNLFILLLSLALVGSLVTIGWGMVRYRLPGKLWRSYDKWKEPIPHIEFSKTYWPVTGKPKYHFTDADASPDALAAWRTRGRDKLRELLGVNFPTAPYSARSLGSDDLGDVTRELLILTAPDNLEIPAYLIAPKAPGKRAALVVVPGHSSGIVATAGVVQDYQHAKALTLARAGYVVLTMEVRGFGYLARMSVPPEGVDVDCHVAYALVRGTTALGMTMNDVAGGFNYLATLPSVDAQRFGLVGFSSGGRTAIYYAALDDRVRAVIASGCVMSNDTTFRYSGHGAYEAVPQKSLWLEMSDCLGLIAPRPLLVHWGEKDNNVQARCAAFNESSLTEYAAAEKIYQAAGAAKMIEKVITPNLGHEFDNAAAIEFLGRHLPPAIP